MGGNRLGSALGSALGSTATRGIRALAALGLAGLGLAGCASGGSTPTAGSSPSRVTISYDRGAARNDLAYTRDDHVSRDTIARRRGPLMQRLTTVYRDLGLPVNVLDPTGFAASTGTFTVQGRVGGVPADRYFNCGFSATGGSRAQSYGLTVTVTTQLAPAPADSGSTLVMTGVSAFARQAGMSSNPVPCTSTGALEQRIVAALRAGPSG